MLDLRRSAYFLVPGHQLGFRSRGFVFNNAMYAMPMMPTRKEQLREQRTANRNRKAETGNRK
jgi:hypothetical protein